jgi:hypothetical protein
MSADPASAPPQLRPLALGEILDVSIKLVLRSFKTLVAVVLAVGGVFAVVTVLVVLSVTGTGGSDAAAVGAVVAILVLTIALYLLVPVACFRAIADAYLGRDPNWRTSLRFAARRAGSTLWLGLLLVIALSIAFVLFILPYIWLAVAWSVAFPVMLLEGIGGTKAMRRSFRLVRGEWWKCFGTLFVAWLITFVVVIVGSIIGAALGGLAGDDSVLAVLVQQIINVATEAVTLPFFAAVIVVLYVDLRVRKEAFDLALLAEHIAHPDRPASFTPPAPGVADAEPAREPALGE